jgi:hypothetical protein
MARRSASDKKKTVSKETEASEKKLLLKLPKDVKQGGGVTCVYTKEYSLERGLEEKEDYCYGTFHGLVESITEQYLLVLFVYPTGDAPEQSMINLETGIDETFKMAVNELKASPIPASQLTKWKIKGQEAAPSVEAEDEDGENGGEEGDESDGVRYE